jgi:hypothetical protein
MTGRVQTPVSDSIVILLAEEKPVDAFLDPVLHWRKSIAIALIAIAT